LTLQDELNSDRRTVRRDYTASLMSNAKWRALLGPVRRADLDIRQVVVKFVGVDDEKRMQLPTLATQAFADSVEFGPFPLVGIAWLEFPHVALLPAGSSSSPRQHRQDIAAIRSALEATGKQFPLEDTPTGLRVVGHVPR
jgi:hypothetical protein